jgi:hypothetical protein
MEVWNLHDLTKIQLNLKECVLKKKYLKEEKIYFREPLQNSFSYLENTFLVVTR